MSLLTRCTHCHTVFRITSEQLQAHGGKVRCGRCLQIFDGMVALAPDAPLVQQPEIQQPVIQQPKIQEREIQEPEIQEPEIPQALAPAVEAEPWAENSPPSAAIPRYSAGMKIRRASVWSLALVSTRSSAG